MKTITIVFAVLFILTSGAWGTLITQDFAGNYTITGANWDGNGVAVVGTDNNANRSFSLIGNTFTYLTTDSSWIGNSKPFGVADGFVLANALLSDFSTVVGVVYDGSAILSTTRDMNFTAAGPGTVFGAQNPNNGDALTGLIDSNGLVNSVVTIPRQGGELSGLTLGVSGNNAAGDYSTGFAGKAFCVKNGTRASIDTGSSSIAYAFDSITGDCAGVKDGIAGYWDASGSFHAVPGVGGAGTTIAGEITSAFANLFIIRDFNNNLYVSNGIRTMSFNAYLIGLAIAPPSTNPPNAFFVGDPGSSQSALVYAGSIHTTVGTQADFLAPLQGNVVPEPSSYLLLGIGLAVLSARRYLSGLRLKGAAGTVRWIA